MSVYIPAVYSAWSVCPPFGTRLGTGFRRAGRRRAPTARVYIQCIYTVYIQCIYTVYIYSVYIQCIYTVYTVYIYSVYTVYIVYIQCIYTVYIYTVHIQCIYTLYTTGIEHGSSRAPPPQGEAALRGTLGPRILPRTHSRRRRSVRALAAVGDGVCGGWAADSPPAVRRHTGEAPPSFSEAPECDCARGRQAGAEPSPPPARFPPNLSGRSSSLARAEPVSATREQRCARQHGRRCRPQEDGLAVCARACLCVRA
jgi:hypothetical protein